MKSRFDRFLQQFADRPLITSADIELLSNTSSVQLSRWVKEGKVVKLKQGFYLLSDTYRKAGLEPAYIANQLVWPSYIGLEKALEHWGLIPEQVNTWTSITTRRPQVVETTVGCFSYRHVKTELFWGYKEEGSAVIATAEKTLLDMFYMHSGPITLDYIHELRLQNLGSINVETLLQYSKRFDSEKISKGTTILIGFIEEQESSYKEI